MAQFVQETTPSTNSGSSLFDLSLGSEFNTDSSLRVDEWAEDPTRTAEETDAATVKPSGKRSRRGALAVSFPLALLLSLWVLRLGLKAVGQAGGKGASASALNKQAEATRCLLQRISESSKHLSELLDDACAEALERRLQGQVRGIENDYLQVPCALEASAFEDAESPLNADLKLLFDIGDILLLHSLCRLETRADGLLQLMEEVSDEAAAPAPAPASGGPQRKALQSSVQEGRKVLREIQQKAVEERGNIPDTLEELVQQLETAVDLGTRMQQVDLGVEDGLGVRV